MSGDSFNTVPLELTIQTDQTVASPSVALCTKQQERLSVTCVLVGNQAATGGCAFALPVTEVSDMRLFGKIILDSYRRVALRSMTTPLEFMRIRVGAGSRCIRKSRLTRRRYSAK